MLKGEILVLVQCKKALNSESKEFVNLYKVYNHRNYLHESFNKHFDCDIKKIKLLYLTGIYFINREKNIYHSWSKNDKSFEALEKITNKDNIPLIFFDVQKQNLLIKNYGNQNTFDLCTITSSDSFICNEDRYNYIEIMSEKEELTKIFEGIKSQVEIKEVELFQKLQIEQKSENKTNVEIYESHLGRKIDNDKRFILNEPDALFLNNNNENLLTTFKINEKQCLAYYDSRNKKMKYAEIKSGKPKTLEFKDMKIYYLKKKTEREKDDE